MWPLPDSRRQKSKLFNSFTIFPHMINPENDPILNASSINSEDYWFLKLNNMEQPKPEAQPEEKAEGNADKE